MIASRESRGDRRVEFLYKEQAEQEIPRDVTHVRVDPSVEKIVERAFQYRDQLEEVELCEGVGKVGTLAFGGCKYLKRVRIPSTVKKICERAFYHCMQLEELDLCEGVGEIGEYAFYRCKSLKRVRIPSTVKKIGGWAFGECVQLEEVELCEGVGEVGGCAFNRCVSLKHIRIPPTVKKIDRWAFGECGQLEGVELCEGVGAIGEYLFYRCKSLKRVRIPPSVKNIDKGAFQYCEQLEEVEFCEGLTNIGGEAFARCKSLRHIAFPSTLFLLGEGALFYCHKLEKVDLHEGLELIAEFTFENCRSLQRIRIPSTVRMIGKRAFMGCIQLASIELVDGLEEIGKLALQNCFSLRNISVPSTVKDMGSDALEGCHDVRRLLRTKNERANALQCRFDGLPLHQLCYDQSRRPSQEIFEHLQNIVCRISDQAETSIAAESSPIQMKGNGNRVVTWNENNAVSESSMTSGESYSPWNIYNTIDPSRDCLGMTPLHIVACSTKQKLDLYQFIIAKQPKCLITKDKWGCFPIFYAIRGSVPTEILQFLIDSQKSAFPDVDLNWDVMVSTLCRAGTPPDVVQKLLKIKQASFSEQSIDWQRTAQELTIRCLVECDSFYEDFPSRWELMIEALSDDHANQGLIESLLETRQTSFHDKSTTIWQAVCEEFVKPLKGWWQPGFKSNNFSTFQFLVRSNIPERMNTIGIRKWQMDIKCLVETVPSIFFSKLGFHFDTIHSKLVYYECEYNQMKDAMFLLELALWKSKIDDSTAIERYSRPNEELGAHAADMKRQCRMNCGAEIIIPNILPYLIPDV